MNPQTVLWLTLSIALPNFLLFLLLKKILLGRPDPGMRFLAANIFKDVAWCVAWLAILERTRANFLAVVLVFLAASLVLYFFAVKEINKN